MLPESSPVLRESPIRQPFSQQRCIWLQIQQQRMTKETGSSLYLAPPAGRLAEASRLCSLSSTFLRRPRSSPDSATVSFQRWDANTPRARIAPNHFSVLPRSWGPRLQPTAGRSIWRSRSDPLSNALSRCTPLCEVAGQVHIRIRC